MAAPAGQDVWLHIGQVEAAPQWIAGDATTTLDAGGHHSAQSGILRIEQEGRPLLLHVRSSAGPADWVVERQGDALHVLLRVAPAGAESARTVALALWRPVDGEPATWSRLVAEEMK